MNYRNGISMSQLLQGAGVPPEKITAVMLKLDPPNPSRANQSTQYLRSLVERTGRTEEDIATLIGIPPEELRANIAANCPYPVQFCLEVLAVIAAH